MCCEMSTLPARVLLPVAAWLAPAGCAIAPQPAAPPEPAPQVAAYGAWETPVSAERLAAAAVRLGDLQVFGGHAYWRESRPGQRGRNAVVSRDEASPPQEHADARFNVRTRVHEYGGASYLYVGEDLVFSDFADQRLYWQQPGAAPLPLTPEGYRYADCVLHPAAPQLVCVREDHTPATIAAHGEQRNEIVALPLPEGAPAGDTPGEVLVGDSDFVAYPRLSPDGRWLAWLAWNHPDMPWDTAWLQVAPLRADGVGEAVHIAGGPDEAALEPQWDADGSLYFLNDPDGWWNLYRWRNGTLQAVAPMAREFGGPLWQLGASTYALTGDGRAVVRSSLAAVDELGVLDLETGALRRLELPFVSFPAVRLLDSSTAVAIAAGTTNLPAVIRIDLADGTHQLVNRAVEAELSAEWISWAEHIEFPTRPGPDGRPRTAHAFFYLPTNPDFRGPEGRKPPLLVMVHGGPTSVARPVYSLHCQYWTSRGFAVVDVNYGGSTTFGREYRRRLNGRWGIVDVEDVVAAVDYLVEAGRVDGERVAIRGGSAGGYTALAALAFTDRFVAAANYYGVSDIRQLAETSHKFERNYDVSLIGPRSEENYRARSPLSHLEGFNAPLITFQGAEDRIVVPEQSRRIVTALRERGIPSAYLEFEGEQHGFRRAENIIRAAEAELYFYGRVFGFTPAGELPPVEIVPALPGDAAP